MITTSSYCVLFCALAASVLCVHSQSQAGFISIDCGVSKDYTDNTTGIYYSSDQPYIKTGVNNEVQSLYKATAVSESQFNNVRSFPNGTRNCYTLAPQQGKNGTKYLIRARFMYGNYDSENVLPQFDLYLGVNLWSTITFTDVTSVVSKELVQVPSSVTYICLVNTGLGTPFISAIELRPLISLAYVTPSDTIELHRRVDFGNEVRNIRFPNDAYDRIWESFIWNETMNTLSTSLDFDAGLTADEWFLTPNIVMQTAVTPQNASNPIEFYWKPPNSANKYYAYLHFGEVQILQSNQTREFDIKLNGVKTRTLPLTPNYLYSTVIYDTKPVTRDWFNYSLERTANSTLPPIINALEVFLVKDLLQSETDQIDVSAMKSIQTAYGLVKDWVADPCAPQNYTWDGVDCSYNDYDPPRVISLNLTSSGLKGKISESIFNLSLLQHLDLSNNNLQGSVPGFLSQMTYLTVLNLSGNNLTGTIPSGLTEKSQQGSLLLSVDGNPNLCSSSSCTTASKTTKKNSVLVPVIVSVVVVVVLLLVAAIIFWRLKSKKHEGSKTNNSYSTAVTSYSEEQSFVSHQSLKLKARNQRFSFSDILSMTNNFERVLGQGGFGKVYYGTLDETTEVAVKMLNPSSSGEGYKQFHTEAEILMRVHHGNLTSMIGYCYEGEHLGVVYEFMANGNLGDYLSPVKNPRFPSWEQRLKIALDAAQGLEYLHNGCKPPIIHRDVKSTNILLNENLQAKFADFGISKTFPNDRCTHVSTAIMGTPGYIDPELINSYQLNEKSDVYGFGMVLFEIITGQRAIIDSGQGSLKDNISNWVSNIIATKGDVRAIVDPRLHKNFDVNSAWKFVETATACVSSTSSRRPTMNQVVIDLKQCLEMEKARKYRDQGRTLSNDSVDQGIFLNVNNAGPAAR